jgi:hypothetical protein
MSPRVCLVSLMSIVALVAESSAGVVNGKLELPAAPERAPVSARGFLERVENPVTPVKQVNVAPQLVVVLEGEMKPEAAGQVTWELAGESFTRPVLAVPSGAEVIIKNTSKTARTLVAAEDAQLIQGGPINPTAIRSFRATTPGIYTIGDKDAPHLRGKLVVVATPYLAYVEVSGTTGKFEIEAAEGSYKLRVFYKDGWIVRPEDTVTVPAKAKGKGEVNVSIKIPPGYPTSATPAATPEKKK